MLAELITGEAIRLNVGEADWEGVVEVAGELLVSQGVVEAGYVEAMKHVVREYGTYVVIAPGVALLHADPRAGVKQAGLSLVTLDPPVPFGHPEYDPVDIAIALGVEEDGAHLGLLSELAEILCTKKKVERIRQADDREDVIDVLSA